MLVPYPRKTSCIVTGSTSHENGGEQSIPPDPGQPPRVQVNADAVQRPPGERKDSVAHRLLALPSSRLKLVDAPSSDSATSIPPCLHRSTWGGSPIATFSALPSSRVWMRAGAWGRSPHLCSKMLTEIGAAMGTKKMNVNFWRDPFAL